MKNTTTPRPIIAPRRRARRFSARRPGEVRVATARTSAVTVVMRTDAVSRGVPQPRVDEEVGEIGDEIERDVRRRGAKHHALHDGVIAIEYRVDDELAEAGDREHLLGQHRAREKRAEFSAPSVITGVSALRSACLSTTTRSSSPFARAVRT